MHNINMADSRQILSTSVEKLRSGASYGSFADFQKALKDYETEHLCYFDEIWTVNRMVAQRAARKPQAVKAEVGWRASSS